MSPDQYREALQVHFDRFRRLLDSDPEEETNCKRKLVRCWAFTAYEEDGELTKVLKANNGSNYICSNEVGNCGCAHAETRVILGLMKTQVPGPFVLLVNYSPCSNCANLIVDSKLIIAVAYRHVTEHDKRGLAILQKNSILDVQISERHESV